jgi:hypothetical protein
MKQTQSSLDEANSRLRHIGDCFTLKYDPHDCAITAKILTAEALATKQTRTASDPSGVLIGLTLAEQRTMISDRLDQLAGIIGQGYKTQILDRRDQMEKATQAQMQELIAKGESQQAAWAQTHPVSAGSVQAAQRDDTAISKGIIRPHLPEIREQMRLADRVMPQSDPSFPKGKEEVQHKCEINLVPFAYANECADSLYSLAATIKPRIDGP